MNVIFKRLLASGGILLLLMALGRGAQADDGDGAEVRAQRLEHVLGYLASDYGGAVSGGVVTNQAEHEEHLSLLDEAEKMAARLPAVTDLPARVEKLRSLVAAKATEADVLATTDNIRGALMASYRLSDAPQASPNAARGKALYEEHCTTCHGPTGRGDTVRAASLTPRPANFHDPEVGGALSPYRIANTVRFGISGTAMIPFTFFTEADRWDVAFYVSTLRHAEAAASDAPVYALAELARRSDQQLHDDLVLAGVAEDRTGAMLADLRRRAPYDDRLARSPLALARTKLDRARIAITRGERDAARAHVMDAYLEGVEPAEGALGAADPGLARGIEERFTALRSEIQSGAPADQITATIAGTLQDLTRAERVLAAQSTGGDFVSTAVQSGLILLREGVEAALLIAALLGLAAQSGAADKKRFIHLGWVCALGLGLVTWAASSKLVTMSGARREIVEGATALLATAVLFYVSYSLLAKREVARWMKFLREQISPRRAALSLFGVAFLAAYREAFETVLFYQSLLSSSPKTSAALLGAAGGAAILIGLVVVYTRAGKFAPPQVFFRASSWLLYSLAVVFAGQGIAALQVAGVLPMHAFRGPSVPALGVHPTFETCSVQLTLVLLAVIAVVVSRRGPNVASSPPVARVA